MPTEKKSLKLTQVCLKALAVRGQGELESIGFSLLGSDLDLQEQVKKLLDGT